jgi:uncharacterized membrane protein
VPNDEVARAIDQYCARLGKALHGVPPAERDDLITEVRTHILERLEAQEEVTALAVEDVLGAVGEPAELASEYRTGAMLRRAMCSPSPWLLVRATLHWAMTGAAGVVAFLAVVVGYGSAAVFMLSALLKPLFPSRIGLWLGPEQTLTFGFWNERLSGVEVYGVSVRPPASFVLGTFGTVDGPVRDLLGVWLIPLGIVCAFLLFFTTTLVARWWIAKFSRTRWKGSLPLRRAAAVADEA